MQFDFDPTDINIIMQHLEVGQFKTVAPVLMKIQSQVMAQQASQPAPAPADEGTAVGGTD